MSVPRPRCPVSASVAFLCCLLAGCALRAVEVGLVEDGPRGGVRLQTSDGRELCLFLSEPARPLMYLDGCLVELEGKRLCRLLVVDRWVVLDAGDGSQPFVGILRRHGSHLVVDDMNSGMPVLLELPGARALEPYVGKLVLVSGFVVGPQVVRIVDHRVLSE